ncbi:Repressor of RNA polymerase III transcription MAF1 [Intoshia linei]|uniref:Repressor of RNA polymerase III transcription MAF1 homolog n=1 Tax=Intoshia linei TaxID=1819745 RepID=A0A177AYQ1_9BILA|nr:Repressor of RNA polymerase III transcription MAF1 [Intoshia linei]
MKIIPDDDFITFLSKNNALKPDPDANFRLAHFSIKMIKKQKKIYKKLDLESTAELTIPESLRNYENVREAMGDDYEMIRVIERKTLYHLQLVLNLIFDGYNFVKYSGKNFSRQPYFENVKSKIEQFTSLRFGQNHVDYVTLWSLIDRKIDIDNAEIYSFKCVEESRKSDPFAQPGIQWGFAYFFYNRVLKNIIYMGIQNRKPVELMNEEERNVYNV